MPFHIQGSEAMAKNRALQRIERANREAIDQGLGKKPSYKDRAMGDWLNKPRFVQAFDELTGAPYQSPVQVDYSNAWPTMQIWPSQYIPNNQVFYQPSGGGNIYFAPGQWNAVVQQGSTIVGSQDPFPSQQDARNRVHTAASETASMLGDFVKVVESAVASGVMPSIRASELINQTKQFAQELERTVISVGS